MNKAFLVLFATVLTVMTIVSVSAISDLNIAPKSVKINGAEVSSSDTIAAFGGDVIPVKVTFLSNELAHDVVVKAEINGYRDEISSKTGRFVIENGSIYTKTFSLTLPKDIDVSEEFTLEISIFNKDKEFDRSFSLQLQRNSYNVEILSADMDREVEAGSSLPVDVVIKNRGYERLDDLFVTVRIPKLGIEKRAYFEDLTPVDEIDGSDKLDSEERRMFVGIPSSAEEGVYDVEVIAYNSDSEAKVTRTISVIGTKAISEVVVPSAIKEISAGSTAVYNVIIINRGNSLGVYEIVPESIGNLLVSVDEPVVTIPAGSSKTINVQAKAGNAEGTYNFAVNVNSDNKIVKKVNLTANVTKGQVISATSNITILTIVLAIVFVVLLIVLIVLLTRKPAKSEEIEESYY